MHRCQITCCMTNEKGPGVAPYVPVAKMADAYDGPNRCETWIE